MPVSTDMYVTAARCMFELVLFALLAEVGCACAVYVL